MMHHHRGVERKTIILSGVDPMNWMIMTMVTLGEICMVTSIDNMLIIVMLWKENMTIGKFRLSILLLLHLHKLDEITTWTSHYHGQRKIIMTMIDDGNDPPNKILVSDTPIVLNKEPEIMIQLLEMIINHRLLLLSRRNCSKL